MEHPLTQSQSAELAAEFVQQRVRPSLNARVGRWQAKRWAILQCAAAAGVAFFIAHDLLGHSAAFFAPSSAVVSLGISYGQRLRRVLEVAVGVSVGVTLADLIVAGIGRGAWQMALIVALGMTVAVLMDTGTLIVNQVAIQSIFVAAVVPAHGAIYSRWIDALIGGAVALVAAMLVPAEAFRQPAVKARAVLDRIALLLRAAAGIVVGEPGDHGFDLLAQARNTDALVVSLRAAAADGLAVSGMSPFRLRQREHVRHVAAIVDPLDRSLRSTRVLVRMTAVAAHRGRVIPEAYAEVIGEIAAAAETIGGGLAYDTVEQAIPQLMRIADATAHLPRGSSVSADAVLVQMRTIVVDLLEICGFTQIEATDALPPVAPRTP